ncbi:tripartite tricarboxylate transporter TctB family protein [Microvirga aerilata]|uniref:Tripartite tricarboxylate transporter TctB family protein n=1 Tax=Microvirga aerilata TaxID=670292 RepID=A0A937CYG2_9HYPH|nr:tripartite tricarboxylate transporter TctB family protein [Microvirga aerilata]MBL0403336.1 tripartite tricarboxylate transporter TctB family protein [Microvirga aerilata]
MHSTTKLQIGNLALGAILFLLAVLVAVETVSLTPPTQQATVGPAFFPLLVALGLAANAAALFWQALRGRVSADQWLKHDMAPMLIVLAGLVLQMALLTTAGWIVATTLLFATVARAFGSRRIVLDLLIGFLLSAASFYMFNEVLGLSLPQGWIVETFMND